MKGIEERNNMEEWKEIKISDICTRVTSGGTPKSTIAEYYGGSIPWLNTKEVNFNRIYKTEKFITDLGLENSSAKLIATNSIVVAMYGATAGKSAIIKIPLTTNQACCNLTIDPTKADYRFVYYALYNDYDRLASFANGGAQQNLNAQQIKDFHIPYPSLEKQKRIVNILSSLDDKIELNNRINANLEEQAQALFRRWFVDFEFPNEQGLPYKSNGGAFANSEVGLIPQKWILTNLGEVTSQIKEKVNQRNDVKVLSPINTGKLVLSEDYFTKQIYSTNINKYIIVKPYDFAYNPARVNIGSLGMNTFNFDGCVSPVYVVFRCEKRYQYFFDFFRKSERFKKEVESRAIGGVRQNLNYDDFSLIQIVYPTKDVIENFNILYSKILDQVNTLDNENKSLIFLRDTLLPRLMNNQIKI